MESEESFPLRHASNGSIKSPASTVSFLLPKRKGSKSSTKSSLSTSSLKPAGRTFSLVSHKSTLSNASDDTIATFVADDPVPEPSEIEGALNYHHGQLEMLAKRIRFINECNDRDHVVLVRLTADKNSQGEAKMMEMRVQSFMKSKEQLGRSVEWHRQQCVRLAAVLKEESLV
jgi:hypothetical protein